MTGIGTACGIERPSAPLVGTLFWIHALALVSRISSGGAWNKEMTDA